MWRSAPRPTLGWGRPIVAVSSGLILPAIPAAVVLWWLNLDVQFVTETANAGLRFIWFVAACLMATPVVAWLAVPIAVPLVRMAAIRGWAGPASLIGLSLVVGLTVAHFVLNGDLTDEAPEMIPYLAVTLGLQALCGWIILRGGQTAGKMVRNARSA